MYFLPKMQNVKVFVLKQVIRQFSSSNMKLNISRQNKFIKKLINKHQSKRNPLDLSNSLLFGSTKKKPSHVKRRVNVLNKVFMEHITDLLSTGEIEPELLNRNIEISHVEVHSNFKLISVFWIDNGISSTSDTPELLKKCAYQLRHELTQLRVIGNVPPIQFVKYKGISALNDVEEKIKIADFGEDHIPSLYPHAINHEISSIISVNKEKYLDKNIHLEDTHNIFSVTLPVMRHDVFELDHYKIMSKIKSSLNKSKSDIRKQTTGVPSVLISASKLDLQSASNFLTEKEQEEQFHKFLIERRKEQRHKYKKYSKNGMTYDIFEEASNDDSNDDCYVYNDSNEADSDNCDDIHSYENQQN